MNTEMTDNKVETPTGWIFFDGECAFCMAQRLRWGRIFERRGFVWLPLQTPGTAKRLGLSDTQLRQAMRLLLADGRTLGGADAWMEMVRSVWWGWPLWLLSCLPGVRQLLRKVYRVIAANRHCLGGVCSANNTKPTKSRTARHRHTAFLEFP